MPINVKAVNGLKNIIASIWPQLTLPQRLNLILAFAGCLGTAVSNPLLSFFFAKLIGTFYTPDDRKAKAMKYSLAVLAIAILDTISSFIAFYKLNRCGQIWVNNLRLKALGSVLAQPRLYFDEEANSASLLAQTLDSHAEIMQQMLARFFGAMFMVAITVTITMLWSLVTCWKLALVMMACAPIVYAISNAVQVVSGKLDRLCMSTAEKAGVIFTETLTSIKTVRALMLKKHFRGKYQEAIDTTLRFGMQRAIFCGVLFGLSKSLLIYVTALIYHYGSVLLASGEVTLMTVSTVFTLLLFGLSGCLAILSSIPQMSIAEEAANRVLQLAKLQNYNHEHEGTAQISNTGDITLQNLSFAYPTRPTARVLDNINLSIPEGRCIALVDLSGCGKSTIASLLLKLYPLTFSSSSLARNSSTTDSDITFSHRYINHIHTPTLRSRVAIVSQVPTIFPASVAEDVAYGLPESSPLNTREKIVEAALAAGIHDFITSLSDGYDTMIGEGGTGLSGGQAQRIAVSRALIRQPNVLILDEATSALDVNSAMLIRDTIRTLLNADRSSPEPGKAKLTVIIITHSRDMMRLADEICLLDGGRISEVGSWDQLLRRKGAFVSLV